MTSRVKTITSLIGNQLLKRTTSGIQVVSPSQEFTAGRKKRLFGLYFAASWCPFCRAFTPQLESTLAKSKSDEYSLDVIWNTHDRDPESFTNYFTQFNEINYAIPWESYDLRERLDEAFNVQGIPTLVILTADGKIITDNGRQEIAEEKEAAVSRWFSMLDRTDIKHKFSRDRPLDTQSQSQRHRRQPKAKQVELQDEPVPIFAEIIIGETRLYE